LEIRRGVVQRELSVVVSSSLCSLEDCGPFKSHFKVSSFFPFKKITGRYFYRGKQISNQGFFLSKLA
jgi:hypothetical protein